MKPAKSIKKVNPNILHPQISLNGNFGISRISNQVDLNVDLFGPRLVDNEVTVRGQIL